jgi:hypothetical protein
MIDTIREIASVAGFFLGIVYSIGLMIVTIHLNRYGITSVNLVQARYLVVGIVYLIHVLGLAIFSAPFALLIMYFMSIENSAYILTPLGILGLVSILLASYTPITFENKMRKQFKSSLNQKLFWRYWHVTMFLSMLILWHTLARSAISGDIPSKFVFTSLSIAVLFTGVVYYTIFLYHSPLSVGNPILELIGAGRPMQIRLTVDKDKASGLQDYGLFPSQDKLSNPLLLLDETNEEFIVLINFKGKHRAVKINKSVVNSIIYLP